MKVFYHADQDGYCAAAIVKYATSNKMYMFDDEDRYLGLNNNDTIMLEKEKKKLILNVYRYGKKIRKVTIDKNEDVYLLDYCFDDMSVMKELSQFCNFFWIDHHETSLLNKIKYKIQSHGPLANNKSAALLTWKFLMSDPVPLAVVLTDEFDTGIKNNRSLSFHFALTADMPKPNDKFWGELFVNDNKAEEIVKKGEGITVYNSSMNKLLCERASFIANIDGHKAICINTNLRGSHVFSSIWNSDLYDVMILFNMMPNRKWYVSIYSPTADCSKIASKYGGGGHKSAAGCVMDSLQFLGKV